MNENPAPRVHRDGRANRNLHNAFTSLDFHGSESP
jgi:hypothetical protein